MLRYLQVPNIVPSISAVIGGVTPERYVWRFGMALFGIPQIFNSFLYYNFFGECSLASEKWYRVLNRIVWLLFVVQNLALLGLTYVSSIEYFRKFLCSFLYRNYCTIYYGFCSFPQILFRLVCCLFNSAHGPVRHIILQWETFHIQSKTSSITPLML